MSAPRWRCAECDKPADPQDRCDGSARPFPGASCGARARWKNQAWRAGPRHLSRQATRSRFSKRLDFRPRSGLVPPPRPVLEHNGAGRRACRRRRRPAAPVRGASALSMPFWHAVRRHGWAGVARDRSARIRQASRAWPGGRVADARAETCPPRSVPPDPRPGRYPAPAPHSRRFRTTRGRHNRRCANPWIVWRAPCGRGTPLDASPRWRRSGCRVSLFRRSALRNPVRSAR